MASMSLFRACLACRSLISSIRRPISSLVSRSRQRALSDSPTTAPLSPGSPNCQWDVIIAVATAGGAAATVDTSGRVASAKVEAGCMNTRLRKLAAAVVVFPSLGDCPVAPWLGWASRPLRVAAEVGRRPYDADNAAHCRNANAAAWFSSLKAFIRSSAIDLFLISSSFSCRDRITARRNAQFSPSSFAVRKRPSATSHCGLSASGLPVASAPAWPPTWPRLGFDRRRSLSSVNRRS
mmetsp:Transcript_103127/g.204836  ORF Transcript_103127/g.204836 Transcript_103127/m.204836 type:complete len:237 (+) Transcript_103127:226-936(+)